MNTYINTQQLRDIVEEQYLSLQKKPNFVKRGNFDMVKSSMKLPHAVILTGIRRSGKSTLLKQLMDEYKSASIYFSFEDERLFQFKAEDFSKLHEVLIEFYGNHKVLFFDEIQNIEGWERFVRRLMDQGYKCVITGSNASLLSKELGTRLTGRYVSHTVYPFSFAEFLDFKNTATEDFVGIEKKVVLKKKFDEYLTLGGMPEYLQTENIEVLKTVYDDILYRDIITRYAIQDVSSLRQLSGYLSSVIGQTFSYNNLKNLCDLKSVHTVKNYLMYLENSYVFLVLHAYTDSPKKNILNPKKIYGIDHGMMSHTGLLGKENYGRKLENIVYIELLRRYKNMYFYRNAEDHEVDFFVIDSLDGVRQLIQVSWSIADKKTRERELRAITSAMSNLKVDIGYIVSYEEEDELEMNGKVVYVVPAYRWLMEVM